MFTLYNDASCTDVAPKTQNGLGKKVNNLHEGKMYKMLEQRYPSETSLKMSQECVDFWHNCMSLGDLF